MYMLKRQDLNKSKLEIRELLTNFGDDPLYSKQVPINDELVLK